MSDSARSRQHPSWQEPDSVRADEIRRAAESHWRSDPAGRLALGQGEPGTPESFALIEQHRYAEQPWMHQTFHFDRFGGQRVLEIGVGLGTDHLQFARAGARMTGIDLTPRCIDLTRRRFDSEHLRSDLRVMDAEHLDFPDESFDVVYSFGVLHHVPSGERAFAEVRRVLRPGGVFLGALYNRWSMFMAAAMYERLRFREWRVESLQQRLSRIEHSSADQCAGPYVRLLSRRELRRALRTAGFREVEIVVRHSGVKLNHSFAQRLAEAASRYGGWYLIHNAR